MVQYGFVGNKIMCMEICNLHLKLNQVSYTQLILSHDRMKSMQSQSVLKYKKLNKNL